MNTYFSMADDIKYALFIEALYNTSKHAVPQYEIQ